MAAVSRSPPVPAPLDRVDRNLEGDCFNRSYSGLFLKSSMKAAKLYRLPQCLVAGLIPGLWHDQLRRYYLSWWAGTLELRGRQLG
jgi:hypothetical protein